MTNIDSVLDHERFDAYRLSLDLVEFAETVTRGLPATRKYVADQLRRAALSVSLNIAEGAGEFAPVDKRRFYRMARRSATECSAALDVCMRLQLADPETLKRARAIAVRIVSCLTALCRTLEGKPRSQP